MSAWIDISIPVRDAMICWPGDPKPEVCRIADLDSDGCNVTLLRMSAHTGTHVDAPIHFLKHGAGLEGSPPETALGPARVIEIRNAPRILRSHLEPYDLQSGDRILLKTDNSGLDWWNQPFNPAFSHISAEAASLLSERKVRLVGIDYLSVGGFETDGDETHRILLSSGIWLLESLNLSDVIPGAYELCCLTLNLPGSDGAPARALLRDDIMQ